jgi:hypothetical protein
VFYKIKKSEMKTNKFFKSFNINPLSDTNLLKGVILISAFFFCLTAYAESFKYEKFNEKGICLLSERTYPALGINHTFPMDVENPASVPLTPPIPHRFLLSFHSGISIPTGIFDTLYNLGPNYIIDAGYVISSHFHLVAYLGFNDFKGKPTVADNLVKNLSLNLKYIKHVLLFKYKNPYFFLQGGPGLYFPETGDMKFGWNIGLGGGCDIKPWLAAEIGTNYHKTCNSIQFSANHLGLIFKF